MSSKLLSQLRCEYACHHTSAPNVHSVLVEVIGKGLIHVHEKYSLHFIISCQKTLLARAFSRPQPLKAYSS